MFVVCFRGDGLDDSLFRHGKHKIEKSFGKSMETATRFASEHE